MNSSYQQQAQLFDSSYTDRVAHTDHNLRLMNVALGLSGETGEVVDALKKHVFYNAPLNRENVLEELGDVMWYIATLLTEVGSSFEEIQQLNIAKLSKRYPRGYSNASAIARADKAEAK